MQIELSTVGKPYKEGNLTKIELEYYRDGKSSKRTLAGVGKTLDVIKTLSKASPGDVFDIALETKEKNGQTFYNWVGAEPVAAQQATRSSEQRGPGRAPRSSDTDVRISRQNALTNAVNFAGNTGIKDVDGVLAVAEVFAAFTQSVNKPLAEAVTKAEYATAKPAFEDSEDDLPWTKD